VVRLILGQTLRPVMLGSLLGLAGAGGISVLLRAMIVIPDMPDLTYGAGAFSPAVVGSAVAVLIAVIVLASVAPVRRATRIEPSEALRIE